MAEGKFQETIKKKEKSQSIDRKQQKMCGILSAAHSDQHGPERLCCHKAAGVCGYKTLFISMSH